MHIFGMLYDSAFIWYFNQDNLRNFLKSSGITTYVHPPFKKSGYWPEYCWARFKIYKYLIESLVEDELV